MSSTMYSILIHNFQTQVEQLKKELQEIKESAEKESNAAHAAALEKELKANDRLHKELTEVRTTAEETERKLKQNIRELQVALQTVEEKAGYREDNLRQDITVSQRHRFIHLTINFFINTTIRHCKNGYKPLKLVMMKCMPIWMILHNRSCVRLKHYMLRLTR
jgi:DNA repair exonuclease SbcCD ATPase subunit